MSGCGSQIGLGVSGAVEVLLYSHIKTLLTGGQNYVENFFCMSAETEIFVVSVEATGACPVVKPCQNSYKC